MICGQAIGEQSAAPSPHTPDETVPTAGTETDVESVESSSCSGDEPELSCCAVEPGEGCRTVFPAGSWSCTAERERERSPRRGTHCAVNAATTLIIFDWDDTLLPSTWLQEQGLKLDSQEGPSKEQTVQLGRAARLAARTLRLAKHLGKVIIVTNAEKGWVELSCKKFMPRVLPVLEGVKVRSARSSFEPLGVSSPIQWKSLAFNEELEGFSGGASRRANILSLGDSLAERAALLHATEKLTTCWGKSVKFLERPQLELFLRQHRLLSMCLKPIVSHSGKLDLCLRFDGSST